MNKNRQLLVPAYFVALVLFVIPAFDAGTSVAPWHPGVSLWRFAIIGLLSNALLLPTLAGLIATVAATTFEQARVRRVFSVLGWLIAAGLMVCILIFALDAVQALRGIRRESVFAFWVAGGTSVVKLMAAALSFALFAWTCRSDRVAAPKAPSAPGAPSRQPPRR